MSEPLTYATNDVAVVTVLNLHGLHPQRVETEDRRVQFYFERTPHLTEVLDAYNRGSLQVSAKMFVVMYRDAITQMRHKQQQQQQQAARQ